MTFNELATEISARLAVNSTEARERIGRLVNKVYKTVTTAIGLDLSRRSVNVSANTSLGSATVTFSGLEKIERVIDDTSGSVVVLSEVTFDQLRNENPAASDTPSKY